MYVEVGRFSPTIYFFFFPPQSFCMCSHVVTDVYAMLSAISHSALWTRLNLVTDGLPASALSLNKADPDIMQQQPRRHDDRIINGWMFMRYLVIGLYIGVATVGGFVHWYCFYEDGPQLSWSALTSHHACASHPDLDCADYESAIPSTISLSILVGIEMLNAFNSLSENQSLLQVPFWTNLWLVAAVILSLALHMMILHVEFFQTIFSTAALGWGEWQLVIYWSLPVILLDEVMKFITRRLA
jgi:P-type Ca2+ transporter type 2A